MAPRKLWLAGLAWLSIQALLPNAIAAQTAPPVQAVQQMQQMQQAARLWSQVRATHPALADGTVDWDRALVDALPAIRAATDDAQLAAALRRMMAPLGDASLRIGAPRADDWARWPAGGELVEWLPGDVALLHWHGSQNAVDAETAFKRASLELARAKKIIIDLRPLAENQRWPLQSLLTTLIDRPLLLPAERYRFTGNPRPDDESSWDGLTAGFLQLESVRWLPAPGARRRPLAFIVNDSALVPAAVVALQRSGQAVVVAEQDGRASRAGPLQQLWLEHGLLVEFSAGELVSPDGAAGFAPDLVLAKDRGAGKTSGATRAALALLNKKPALAQPPRQAFAVRHDDPAYREPRLPPRDWRALAAIKLWAVIDRYFPARRLMDGSWDDALATCLARLDGVTDALGYGQALQDMAATLDDSHVGVWNRALIAERGDAALGFNLLQIDGKVIVSAVTDPALAATGQLQAGDEIVAIDDETMQARLARLLPHISASTPAGKLRNALYEALRGATGSRAQVTIAGAAGQQRTLALDRVAYELLLVPRHARPIMEVMPGNIAYVDLDRLQEADMEAMFNMMQKTGALVLDMRGYPLFSGRQLAARLNVKGAALGPVSYQNVALAHPAAAGLQLAYQDHLFAPRGALYRGKVIMLIDEHSQSHAEHVGLLLEAAADVTFIGAPSAGANGDMRWVTLPGNVQVSYSGYEVRHADGRQLQRVGIVPQIAVAPTVAGLRAGRDEVLQRALEFIRDGR